MSASPTHDGHRLGPGRAEAHRVGPERVGHDDGGVRVARARGHQPRALAGHRREHRRRIGGEDEVDHGQAHRAGGERAALPQGDVHGPVGATVLAELVGAVERVDDPHPVGGEPADVLEALLGEHDVVGAGLVQGLHQEPVAGDVAGVHDLPRIGALGGERLAHVHQHPAGLDGQARRKGRVGLRLGRHRTSLPAASTCPVMVTRVVRQVRDLSGVPSGRRPRTRRRPCRPRRRPGWSGASPPWCAC